MSVPCLFCHNVIKPGYAVEGSPERMTRHVTPRVIKGGTILTDSTGHVYYQKAEVQLLEWWLCAVCEASWQMFAGAREEINVAASNSVNPQ